MRNIYKSTLPLKNPYIAFYLIIFALLFVSTHEVWGNNIANPDSLVTQTFSNPIRLKPEGTNELFAPNAERSNSIQETTYESNLIAKGFG